MAQSLAEAQGVKVGDTVVEVGGAEGVNLRVVGQALDVDSGPYPSFGVQPAWVVLGQLDALAPPGTPGRGYVMAYRLTNAATDADINKALLPSPSAYRVGRLAARSLPARWAASSSVVDVMRSE